jgi:CcmD family protein
MEPIYIVLVIVIVIWIGIFSYMLHLDKQVKVLKKIIEKIEKNGNK